jgi:hypothetical protein
VANGHDDALRFTLPTGFCLGNDRVDPRSARSWSWCENPLFLAIS